MQAPDQQELAVLCGAGPRPHLDVLEPRFRIRYTDAGGLGDAVANADALLLWDFFSTALREAWPRAKKLRWVHITAAGVDSLLFDELVESPITVTNARGVFDRPIAEFVLMSVLAHAKDAARSYDLQRAREWEHRETELVAARMALIIGTGAIGREVARLLRAVGMRVRGAGRTERTDDPDFGYVYASSALSEYIGSADFVIVVAPLTEQTRGLIDRSVLAAMRPNSYLINVGRGACVVEDDLVAALRAGQLAGAALDVFAAEPLPPNHALWDAPGVTITPHMSGDAAGWLDRLEAQFLDNAERFLAGRPLRNVVDKRLGFVVAAEAGQGHD